MNFAIYNTKFGFIRIEYRDEVVTYLKIVDDAPSFGTKNSFTDMVNDELGEYFDGKRSSFSFSYSITGTDFQKKVYRALCEIPYGETRTYKDIAISIGNEKACRAVGLANNKNPITIVVPCHRVIGANGNLVGFSKLNNYVTIISSGLILI